MKRRELLAALGTFPALALNSAGNSGKPAVQGGLQAAGSQVSDWPFTSSVARNVWTRFPADGFPSPVPGYVYDGSELQSGIPLGALGTGWIHHAGRDRQAGVLFYLQRPGTTAKAFL